LKIWCVAKNNYPPSINGTADWALF